MNFSTQSEVAFEFTAKHRQQKEIKNYKRFSFAIQLLPQHNDVLKFAGFPISEPGWLA